MKRQYQTVTSILAMALAGAFAPAFAETVKTTKIESVTSRIAGGVLMKL